MILCEVNEAAAENALARIRKSLARAEKSGKLSRAEREAAEGRLRTATDVAELADRDLVVEAVIEDEAEKVRDLPGARQGGAARTPCWPATRPRSRS